VEAVGASVATCDSEVLGASDGDTLSQNKPCGPQEHPENPQVNMKGEYSEVYLQRHPTAPPMVDWTVRCPSRVGEGVKGPPGRLV